MEYNLPIINITKELIESKISQEELISTYYGVPVKKGLFKATHRSDAHETCAYYWSKKGRLVIKDFGSDYSGDWIYVLMNKEHCSYIEALKIAANDFGIIKDSSIKRKSPEIIKPIEKLPEKEQAIINVEIRDWQDYELKWWGAYGISKNTLEKFNIYSCKNIFLNGQLFSLERPNQHIYAYYGGMRDKIETWRLYFPMRKNYRFLSNWKASQIQGAKQLPRDGGDYLIITKSMKDVLVLYEMGIPAIAPNSENLFVTKEQYKKLNEKFKHIILLYDNDIPGIKAARKIHKEFPDLKITYIPRKYKAKDISDFRKKYGKDETQKLIDLAKRYYFGKENNSKSTSED